MSFSYQFHFVPREAVSIIRFGGRCRDYCHIFVFSELMEDYVELVKEKDNLIQKEENDETMWMGNFIGLVSLFVPY